MPKISKFQIYLILILMRMKLLYFTYAVIADEINTKKDPNCVLVIICYFIWW